MLFSQHEKRLNVRLSLRATATSHLSNQAHCSHNRAAIGCHFAFPPHTQSSNRHIRYGANS